MKSRKLAGTLAGSCLSLFVASSAMAHHSAAQFDFRSPVTISGVVKVARFENPHGKLILEVTDDERGTRDIEFEAHSRNNMVRQGLLPDMFKVGDSIMISIAPTRTGQDGGYVTALLTEDGRAVGNITAPD